MTFEFQQPVMADAVSSAAAAVVATSGSNQEGSASAGVLDMINYDRSPSLVADHVSDASAADSDSPAFIAYDIEHPQTPIVQHQFTSFAEAEQAFAAWMPTCNWPKPPDFRRFWWASEFHIHGEQDFVAWSYQQHPLWVKNEKSEFVPRVVDVASEPIAETTIEVAIESTDIADAVTTATTSEPVAPAKLYTDEEYAEICRNADEDHALEIQRLENLYAETSMERSRAQDRVKALKQDEKDWLDELRDLKAKGPTYPKNEVPVITSEEHEACGNQEENFTSTSTDAQPVETSKVASSLDVDPDRYARYLALPIQPVIKDVAGLGKTKLAAVVDQCKTIGGVVALQTEFGQHWYKQLGKGFGAELGSRIEDAVANALEGVE